MSNKAQLRHHKARVIFVNTVGSTADRDTEYNDLGFNDYPWKVSNSILAGQKNIKYRKDIIL
jgi:hypothetical protein